MHHHPGSVAYIRHVSRALDGSPVDLRQPHATEEHEHTHVSHVEPSQEKQLEQTQHVGEALLVAHVAGLVELVLVLIHRQDVQMDRQDPVHLVEEKAEHQNHRQIERHGESLVQHRQLHVDHQKAEIRNKDDNLSEQAELIPVVSLASLGVH